MQESTKNTKSTKVGVSGYIQFPDSADLQRVRKALEEHVRLTREEPGCLMFRVIEDESIPGKFIVEEEFESQSAFEHHQERTQKSAWAQISAQAGRHYSFR